MADNSLEVPAARAKGNDAAEVLTGLANGKVRPWKPSMMRCPRSATYSAHVSGAYDRSNANKSAAFGVFGKDDHSFSLPVGEENYKLRSVSEAMRLRRRFGPFGGLIEWFRSLI